MKIEGITLYASLIVFGSGALWGLYWVPVRHLAGLELTGAWGTLAITLAAALILVPVSLKRRDALMRADRRALASVALGGAAFVLYSVGFVYGRVAIIVLLFFLTPVWSTLIGRYVMGWPTPRLRLLAIAAGLVGLGVMLGADGQVPLPRGAGEWLALASGVLWSVATTGMRVRPSLGPPEAAFVFAVGASMSAAVLAPLLSPMPAAIPHGSIMPAIGWALMAGGAWWGLSMICLMWATARLEPARVGILLMTEVIVGSASAAWLAGEGLRPLELVGGSFVLCAGVLEVWPLGRRRC